MATLLIKIIITCKATALQICSNPSWQTLNTYTSQQQRGFSGCNWAATWQNQQGERAPSEDSDQPGHPPSLIRVFAVRTKKAWVLSYPLSSQWRLWVLAGRTRILLVLSCRGSFIWHNCSQTNSIMTLTNRLLCCVFATLIVFKCDKIGHMSRLVTISYYVW